MKRSTYAERLDRLMDHSKYHTTTVHYIDQETLEADLEPKIAQKGFEKMREAELQEINPELDNDINSDDLQNNAKKKPEGLDEITEDQRSAIKEKVRERKFVFQFIDHETGKRSEPFIGNYDLLREILQEAADRGERPDQEDYVLLVAVIGETDEDTLIPGTPLVKCKTLLDLDDIEKGV